MASSVRERIAEAAKAAIAPMFTQPGATVYRSLLTPLPRSVEAAAKVDWTQEQGERLTHSGDECALELHVAVMVRAQEGAEAIVDGYMVQAHALLMAERTLGGLCADIAFAAAGKAGAANEQEAVEIAHVYRVTYRRRTDDLTQ